MQNGLGIGSSKDLGGAELDFKPQLTKAQSYPSYKFNHPCEAEFLYHVGEMHNGHTACYVLGELA